MKNKRLIATVLTIVMLFAIAPMALAVDPSTTAPDPSEYPKTVYKMVALDVYDLEADGFAEYLQLRGNAEITPINDGTDGFWLHSRTEATDALKIKAYGDVFKYETAEYKINLGLDFGKLQDNSFVIINNKETQVVSTTSSLRWATVTSLAGTIWGISGGNGADYQNGVYITCITVNNGVVTSYPDFIIKSIEIVQQSAPDSSEPGDPGTPTTPPGGGDSGSSSGGSSSSAGPATVLDVGAKVDLDGVTTAQLNNMINDTLDINDEITAQVDELVDAALEGVENATLVVIDGKTIAIMNKDGTLVVKIIAVNDNAVVVVTGEGKVDAIIAPSVVEYAVDAESGKVTATNSVGRRDAAAAIETAVAEYLAAKAEGGKQTSKPLTVTIPGTKKADKDGDKATVQNISLPAALLEAMVDSDVPMELKLPTPLGTTTFNQKALDAIAASTEAGRLVFTVEAVDMKTFDAPDEVKAIIGDKPVFDFNLTVGGVAVTSFGAGKVTIELPYTLKEGENPNAIIAYYVDDDGNLTMMRGSYSAATKSVSFVTSHFSLYFIDEAKVMAFTDVAATNPYKDAIEFLAAREITQGVGNNLFAPDRPTKRIEQLVMIMRAFGIKTEENTESLDAYRFTDAAGKWYDDQLATARKLGIVEGVADNMFYGDEYITCAQMMLMLYRTLSALDELDLLAPSSDGKTLADFTDAEDLGWAEAEEFKSLIVAVLESGIYQEELLNAHVHTDRAQMAQLLYNLLVK